VSPCSPTEAVLLALTCVTLLFGAVMAIAKTAADERQDRTTPDMMNGLLGKQEVADGKEKKGSQKEGGHGSQNG
jgi:hypothetical protein